MDLTYRILQPVRNVTGIDKAGLVETGFPGQATVMCRGDGRGHGASFHSELRKPRNKSVGSEVTQLGKKPS